uniref:DSBA-like thioredoxin domain n=1 Tax=Caudovirales sp. ctrNG92 TaxID=2827638 RepID=A0A8S5SF68_9CAUD|nr:MAG TPA: DSBA-like thioredoxin domain [Caudovirales sp. ctrNG92]
MLYNQFCDILPLATTCPWCYTMTVDRARAHGKRGGQARERKRHAVTADVALAPRVTGAASPGGGRLQVRALQGGDLIAYPWARCAKSV